MSVNEETQAVGLVALRRALRGAGVDIVDLEPLIDTGLAHEHVWLRRRDGLDWVARIPKQSQMNLGPQANLDYEAACFRRACVGGHTPALHGVLPPGDDLPRGALLVTAIEGRPADLPADLEAIAEALASLHRLALPLARDRPPLLAPRNPWQAMIGEIRQQATFLDAAEVEPDVLERLTDELTALESWVTERSAPTLPVLISFDAHPGNFLIDRDGRAILVDLEKCRYGPAGLDLAHSTLYTSTTWDMDSRAVLGIDAIRDFHRAWAAALDGSDDGTRDLPIDRHGVLQARRAMWLWSTTWCAQWRVAHRASRDDQSRGQDWSAELSDVRLIAHVRERVDHYLSPTVVARICDEWQTLCDVDLFGR